MIDVYKVAEKLIGPVNPIGETNTDNVRFDNLEVMTEMVDFLISDIIDVSRGRNRAEYSIMKAGEFADKFLAQIKLDIEDR